MDNQSLSIDVALNRLIGRKLTSVTFVMDYFQIAFDDARLTILTTPELLSDPEEFAWDTSGFAHLLRQQIGRSLRRADVADRKVRLTFESGVALNIPLEAEPSQVEHLILEQGNKRIWVC
jgi:hypothetical protein